MKNSIYQAALKCKSISGEMMETDKTRFIYGSRVYYDYTVKGSVGRYLEAVEELCSALNEEYPAIGQVLQSHKDRFKDDTIIQFTAIATIVDCLLALRRAHKKVFISHSSKDKSIIDRFIDSILQLGIGLSPDDIFCTSIEDMGIKNGEDIRKHIRDNVLSADFSFLMISRHYKASEICLNEMGAVWATDNRVRYYLLPDVDFKDIGWLCDTNKADKLINPMALDALEEELTGFYGLPRRGVSWSRQREGFVEFVRKEKQSGLSPKSEDSKEA